MSTMDVNEKNTNDIVVTEEISSRLSEDRLRALYLYQILLQYTDVDHTLTTKQIQNIFQERYHIKIHRTIVPEYINLLRIAGIDVVGQRRRSFHYHLAYREFSIPELKILIDAVQSSKFVTEKRSMELIEKLTRMTCQANADQLKRTTHITGRSKSENEKGYYIVDSINTAINNGKKISFTAFDYDRDKKQVLKNNGKPYTVSPYDLIWDGDFYYMTGYCDERKELRTFRLDRIMSAPVVMRARAVPKPENYRVEHYTMEAFRMYSSTEPTEVQLLCENAVMNAIVDRFGNDIETRRAGREHFRVTCKVCTGPTFFRWIFGWGGQIHIEGPDEVREEYRQALANALDRVDMPEIVEEPEEEEIPDILTGEEGEYAIHRMKLNPGPYEAIDGGRKTIELRLNDEKRKAMQVGDIIIFTHTEDPGMQLPARVIARHEYPTFADLFANLPREACGLAADLPEEAAIEYMRAYYTEDQEEEHGALGLEIEVVRNEAGDD